MAWYDKLSSIHHDERFILATIGVVTFAIVTTMVTTLTIIRDENELPPPQPKTQYITQDTEDSLQLKTVETLLEHPNYSVREVANKILFDRAINDSDAVKLLLVGITNPLHDERIKSLRALWALMNGPDSLAKLHNEMAYSALVRSLELSLGDAPLPEMDHPLWDEFNLRDMAERLCLMFASELVAKYGANKLVKAKFVGKWLSKQAWGATLEERKRRFRHYMDHRSNRIALIIEKTKHSRRGLRALEKAGLVDKEVPRRGIRDMPDVIAPDVIMELDSEGGLSVLRTREHSAEEQRLRRQHREAMVLNDGTRPLNRDDIIERDHGSEG